MTHRKNDPLIVGAKAIAEELGISTRQVYAMRENGGPVQPVKGLGLAVRKSVLDAIGRPSAA